MRMMKSGFTMIELIFVIVILGILAAVALPKFVGMGTQAHISNLESFQGTLNRTVAPTIWAKVATTKKGDLSQLPDSEASLKLYTDIPQEFIDNGSTDAKLNDLTVKDNNPGTDILDQNITCGENASVYRLQKPGGGDFEAKIEAGDTTKYYVVDFCNGTQTSAPKYFIKEITK